MDEFENRLKRDAEEIEAVVSPELQARIDASLRATARIRPVPESRTSGVNLWWASSLTGLAAAIIVIVLINWNQPTSEPLPAEPVARETEPAYVHEIPALYAPRIKTAEFTKPLEEELVKLEADMEKAREYVEKDIDFTF